MLLKNILFPTTETAHCDNSYILNDPQQDFLKDAIFKLYILIVLLNVNVPLVLYIFFTKFYQF